MRTLFAPLALAALLAPGLAYGQAGTLDLNFDGDGLVQTSVGPISGASRVAVQPDGKLLLAGFTGTGASADIALVRYLASGALDPSFGTGGIATANLNGGDFASAITLQADGKIVVAGYSDGDGTPRFTVARFTAAGALDASFAGTGWTTASFGAVHDEATDVLVRPSGEIVAVGFTYADAAPANADWAVAQFTSSGALDASFSADGMQTATPGAQDFAFAAALQSDGKLVVAGSAVTNGGASEPFAVARFNVDGAPDTGFGTNGVATLNVENGTAAFAHTFDVVVRPTGEIVVAGAVWSAGNDPSSAVAQFTATGAVDTGFGGGDGWLSYDRAARACAGAACEQANALTLQSDGKLLVAGFAASDAATYEYLVARVLANGTLDASFNGNGLAAFSAAGGVATDVQMQADGQIVAAGSMADQFGALRLQSGLGATTTASSTESTAGWHLVSPPMSGMTVGTLAGLNLVQGVSDEFAGFSPNLFTRYTGNVGSSYRGYEAPASKREALVPGRGAAWYFFAGGGPGAEDTRGTSRRAPLPVTLSATGFAASHNVQTTFQDADRTGATNGFYLLGNPFAEPFDLSGLSIDATSDAAASLVNVMQVYDGESWRTRTRIGGTTDGDTSDDVAVWQGFFAEVTTDGSGNGPAYNPTASAPLTFTYDASAVVKSPLLAVGKRSSAEAYGLVRFTLAGQLGSTRMVDRAASLFVSDEAALGWDSYHATKLAPLTRSVTLGLEGERAGEAYLQAQRSLPRALGAPLTVPLRVSTPAALPLTLTWSGLETLPAGWAVTLLDRTKRTETPLTAGEAYTFDAAPADSMRFALRVAPARATGAEAVASTPGLHVWPASPNPFKSTAAVRFATSEAGAVRVSVYDMLGRQVALLHDGPVSPNTLQRVELDGAALPVGLYVLRVEQNGRVETTPLVRAH